jgi:hypothetical protein
MYLDVLQYLTVIWHGKADIASKLRRTGEVRSGLMERA